MQLAGTGWRKENAVTDLNSITPVGFTARDLLYADYDIEKVLGRPDSYMHFGRKETFDTWSVGPVALTRDSEILDQANYAVLVASLAAAEKAGDIESDSYELTRASHWACGWVEHLGFLARDEVGEMTKIGRWIHAWLGMLREYPSADDSVLSAMESQESLKGVDYLASRHPFNLELTERQVYAVLALLEKNESLNGEWPREDKLRDALIELKLLVEDEDEP